MLAIRRSWLHGLSLLTCLFALAFGAGSASAATGDPNHVSFTLEGCRLLSTTTLPNADGKFLCHDSEYTTGNLGKNWNELDLVPFRITADNGGGNQAYKVVIALDYLNGNCSLTSGQFAVGGAGYPLPDFGAGCRPGYDVISAPALNTSLSSPDAATNCSISSGAQMAVVPGTGGTDATIFRTLTITQRAGATCVFDYYGRLALGSHLYPGSSLHANLINQSFGTAGIGAKDVSIPVKEILPQELGKTMDAFVGSAFGWTISKTSTPTDLNFTNTCSDAEGARSATVTVTVTWRRLAAVAGGQIQTETVITVTNPAHRAIDVDLTDVIKGTLAGDSTESNLDSHAFPTTLVQPGQTEFHHTYAAPAGTTGLNDTATATYTDPANPDVDIPGNTTASANATLHISDAQNGTATITDTEQISGAGLSFSVDSTDTTPTAGSDEVEPDSSGFTSDDPVTWQATVSGSGHVSFTKTVSVDQPRNTSGALTDTGTLTETASFHAPATGETDIVARGCISGMKFQDDNANGVQDEGESGLAGFQFYVDYNDNGAADSGEPVSNTTGSDGLWSISGIDPGTWKVREIAPAADPAWNCSLPNGDTPNGGVDEFGCFYTVDTGDGTLATSGLDFGNYQNVSISGRKFVDENANGQIDDGEPGMGGVTINLDDPSTAATPDQTTTTADDGSYSFSGLKPGATYHVYETVPDGWICSLPADTCDYSVPTTSGTDVGGRNFANYQNATITVTKHTDPDTATRKFPFSSDLSDGSFLLGNGESQTFDNLTPGISHTTGEDVPDGWLLSSITCSSSLEPESDTASRTDIPEDLSQSSTVTYTPISGEHLTCVYSNHKLNPHLTLTKVVDKTLVHDGDTLTYTIKVSNDGIAAAVNVHVTDLIEGTDHPCGTLVLKSGDDSDGRLDPGETWEYTCVYQVAHGDENSNRDIVNTATVAGATDLDGNPIPTLTASATTHVIHPAIAIDKAGPATAQAGDKVGYVLTVTNPGDTPLTDVSVVDQQCNGDPVTLLGKGGDTSEDTLDPGDVWTYSCSVQTAVGDTAVHNVATDQGNDQLGRSVQAEDSADTTLTQPAQLVLPERITPGAANLVAPTGCVGRAFNARVRGTKIATVTFVLDGKVVKRVRNTRNATLIQLRVNPKRLRVGVHRLVANVTFQASSGTRPKTIRVSFQRCARKLRSIRFTG